jgi:hypothetical protein
VQQWFASNGVDYVRAYPSALLATQSDDLFETAGDAWAPEQWLGRKWGDTPAKVPPQ